MDVRRRPSEHVVICAGVRHLGIDADWIGGAEKRRLRIERTAIEAGIYNAVDERRIGIIENLLRGRSIGGRLSPVGFSIAITKTVWMGSAHAAAVPFSCTVSVMAGIRS